MYLGPGGHHDVSPLADEDNVNHTRLHKFADADALLEVFGHIRALNPDHVIVATGAVRPKPDFPGGDLPIVQTGDTLRASLDRLTDVAEAEAGR